MPRLNAGKWQKRPVKIYTLALLWRWIKCEVDPSCLVSPVLSCLGVVWMQLTDVNCQYLERRGLRADFSSRIQFLSSVVYNWAVFHHIHFIKVSVTRGLLNDWVRIFHCRICSLFLLPGSLSSSCSTTHVITLLRNDLFFKRAAEARGLCEQDGVLRFSCLFPLSPLWLSPSNLLLWVHRTYQGNRMHWVMCGPIPLQAQSSPSLQGLTLWSVSRDHTSQELCECFVWFLLPKLPSLHERFGEGRGDRRCWRRSRSLPQGKEIMKRRAALGRKDKSNSIIIIFSWASLSDEKHAVSLDLVPWISQKSWGRNCFREHSWASISLPEGSWSAGTEALHLSVELST